MPIPADAFLIVIGGMRCGTTTLFSYLSRHPRICPCVLKEPNFFAERLVRHPPSATYEELWDFDPARHRYALEASTGYTKAPLEPNVADRSGHVCALIPPAESP
jgi:hypothetical protein